MDEQQSKWTKQQQGTINIYKVLTEKEIEQIKYVTRIMKRITKEPKYQVMYKKMKEKGARIEQAIEEMNSVTNAITNVELDEITKNNHMDRFQKPSSSNYAYTEHS